VDSALVFGQPLHQVKLQAQHTTNAWRAQIESNELAGKIVLPDDWDYPLQMELTRLYISTAESGDKKAAAGASPSTPDKSADKPVDPRELPPLQIKSADTRLGKAALGRMELLTTRRLNGMSIDSLNLDSATANIKLRGGWLQGVDAKQHSYINGTLDIHDLGDLLSGFGYVETVKGGKGSSNVDLKWSGAIIDPAVARLEGMVDFDLEGGRLLEVDPGAGRLFGLLSVQALPRRLTLDFSDLFGKGLAFDYMRGRFDFKDGNAVTDNFVLDGPSAQVELQGRVGLVARDYDQQLKVIPHFTSSLPLAGAVVGGVVVGAAVLLVEKLLKSNIDRATGINYRVTGSWDNPVMARQE
ncbi:MAG: AsmA-like C-terminal region-containing protein, partial [Pseudomonadota bacterium]|nr:AsmA-like C-terminal region-containing protein [Pseudomonadota bacterium]